MADFFTRVAERTLGLTPAVKPDLPSVFTPASPVEITQETVSEPTIATADRVLPEGEPPRRSTGKSVFQSIAPRRNDGPSSLESTEEREALESSLTTPPVPARQLTRDLQIHLRQQHEPELVSHDVSAFETIKHTIATRPATFTTSNTQTFIDESHRPAPTIQVTIGRVEVRATTPAPTPRKTVEKKQPPHLSLDQYLRDRNGGRR